MFQEKYNKYIPVFTGFWILNFTPFNSIVSSFYWEMINTGNRIITISMELKEVYREYSQGKYREGNYLEHNLSEKANGLSLTKSNNALMPYIAYKSAIWKGQYHTRILFERGTKITC